MAGTAGISQDDRQRILDVLRPCAKFIALYGSGARGELRLDSDVDLAFLPKERMDPFDVLHLAGTLEEKLGRPVDLVDVSTSGPIINWHIARDADLLYADPRLAWSEFRARAPSQYEDLRRERRASEAKLIQEARDRGP
jgi:predicted nucleotidyltransferase